MSLEAVQYVTRHPVGRPETYTKPNGDPEPVTKQTWMQAQAVLYMIADLSDPSGHNCTVGQPTIAQRFDVARERINELVRILVHAGALEKVAGRRAYVVTGVQDHDVTRCGHAWCEKEAKTVFRMAKRGRKRTEAAKGSLPAAAADAAFMAEWATEAAV